MAEETWHEARLIPTSGINGTEEQERRATSALLAVMSSVREFGRRLTQPLGAPSGQLRAFIEVPFELGDRRLYPDGLLRVTRGGKSWTALVEVKTGSNELEAGQLENYLDIAREQGFDALITISNQIPWSAGLHPTKLDKRKLRKVDLHHFSWTQILAEAVIQKEHRGVADPDQAWILGELIRYLEHPRSGALEFDDMGGAWVSARDAVSAGTLRPSDRGAADVAARFDALLRFVSLRLGRTLGTEVVPVLNRKEAAEAGLRLEALVDGFCRDGRLAGAIRIPHAVAPLNVEMDVRNGRVTCSVDIEAPREGKPSTRVNWLVRQLKQAPEGTRLEAFAVHSRGVSTASLLKDVRQDSTLLVGNPTKELRTFRIALTSPLGTKRGRGRGGVIDSVVTAVDFFYESVLQHLKAWMPTPPRMREVDESPPGTSAALVSTALSSQDGIEAVIPDGKLVQESALASSRNNNGTVQDTSIDPGREVERPVADDFGQEPALAQSQRVDDAAELQKNETVTDHEALEQVEGG